MSEKKLRKRPLDVDCSKFTRDQIICHAAETLLVSQMMSRSKAQNDSLKYFWENLFHRFQEPDRSVSTRLIEKLHITYVMFHRIIESFDISLFLCEHLKSSHASSLLPTQVLSVDVSCSFWRYRSKYDEAVHRTTEGYTLQCVSALALLVCLCSGIMEHNRLDRICSLPNDYTTFPSHCLHIDGLCGGDLECSVHAFIIPFHLHLIAQRGVVRALRRGTKVLL